MINEYRNNGYTQKLFMIDRIISNSINMGQMANYLQILMI